MKSEETESTPLDSTIERCRSFDDLVRPFKVISAMGVDHKGTSPPEFGVGDANANFSTQIFVI